MLKSEDAAIHTRPPFDERTVDFLDCLSKAILKDARSKEYGDVITFGFWIRKASIRQIQKQYGELGKRIGRGIVFHIAPSNVAVNFAYSLTAGLLSGNANIVRLPSKPFAQVDLICEAIDAAQKQFPDMAPSIEFVRYGHDKKITDELSAVCDARVIWGGDGTIREIRQSPIGPMAVDIAFADRYSIAVIDAGKYIKTPDKTAVAQNFYNDTYLTDQNACTSPKLVVWLGENVTEAKDLFWRHLYEYAGPRYEIQGVRAVHKLSRMMLLAAKFEGVENIGGADNIIWRVKVETLSDEIFGCSGHSGFFMEYTARNLCDILPVCGGKCQTLGYFGLEKSEIDCFLSECGPKGLDRVVPIGKTMEFSLVWDGYDLIRELSRQIIVI